MFDADLVVEGLEIRLERGQCRDLLGGAADARVDVRVAVRPEKPDLARHHRATQRDVGLHDLVVAHGAAAGVVAVPRLGREDRADGSAEAIASRFGGHADDRARPEGRRGVDAASLDLHVADRVGVDRQQPVGPVLAERAHVGAVDLDHVILEFAAAQEVDLASARGVAGAGHDAGRHLEEVGELLARCQRQHALEFAIDVDRGGRLLHLEQRGVDDDLHRFFEAAHLHRDVDPDVPAGTDLNTPLLVLGKAGQLCRDRVVAGSQ